MVAPRRPRTTRARAISATSSGVSTRSSTGRLLSRE
jgi:hypothetical protein